MVERNLLKFRKPSELRVLCFPGIDAQEIIEVYDPLGIPRQNIVGVERDPKVFRELEKKDLGIRLILETLEDYVQGRSQTNFDVVSLDYLGPLNQNQVSTIRDLLNKQARNSFVLHTANLLRRDHNSFPFYFYGFASATNNDQIRKTKPGDMDNFLEDSIQRFHERCHHTIYGRGLRFSKEEKQIAYSDTLENLFSGISESSTNEHNKFFMGRHYLRILGGIEKELSDLDEGLEVVLDPEDPLGSKVLDDLYLYGLAELGLQSAAWNCLKFECEKYGINEPLIQLGLEKVISNVSDDGKQFMKRDAETYSYISESGAPMIGDVYFLGHPRKQIEISERIAKIVGFPEAFHIKNPYDLRKFYLEIEKFAKETVKYSSLKTIETLMEKSDNRTFLGNSSKPVLTKRRAIEEFRNGLEVEDLREKYRGWSGKSLAQWKAHFTMGTYDEKLPEGNFEENGDLEKITKEEAIDLISSGIPVEEISQTYPTSFSLGSLRSIKAHVTMNSYERN
jgi:hypothetical protein